MTRATEGRGVSHLWRASFDRLGYGGKLHERRMAPPRDLGAERQQLVAVGDDRRTVDGGQAGNPFDGASELVLPQAVAIDTLVQHQVREHGERRAHLIGDWR